MRMNCYTQWGFPWSSQRVLTLQNLLLLHYYLYLLAYNVIYVVPLAVIVPTFSITLAQRNLLNGREGS